MILLYLLIIPFLTGLFLFFFRNETIIRYVALAASVLNLMITLPLVFSGTPSEFTTSWINFMGIRFALGFDGISLIMILLTNILFPFILLAGFTRVQKNVSMLNFLILTTQSALLGVFMAQNAFLFYVFWEMALIPVYFILLIWGGDDRRSITLKFFIYTLTGSLFLLFGIIYLYQLTPGTHTTDFSVFRQLIIPENSQIWLFLILFIAFAIKMPVFPFHTWQPTTYKMASTQGAMILAGVMTKMGIYGALRFLFPIVPLGVLYWQNLVIILSLAGVIYASVIAFRHTNLKTMIAYSSMAHISLMSATMFVLNEYALQGLLFQVISHGVTIAALFYMACLVKEQTGTTEFPQLGGLKSSAPNMSILFLIIILGSIALPLTAGFVGEFLMITGLLKQSVWFALFGGMTMILGAIYMLYAFQRVMLGEKRATHHKVADLVRLDYVILIPLIILILGLGIYPQPIFNLMDGTIQSMKEIISPVSNVVSMLAH
jgi:NADH-quinone oxidoreductase subunit M